MTLRRRPKLNSRGVVFCAVIAVLAVSCAVFFAVRGGGRVLRIKDADSGRVYGSWPLEESGEFAVEFIHSVNQSPVRDIFTVKDRLIQPRAVRFYAFGAGVLSDLDEGQTLTRDGDAMIISGFTATFRELNYIVGTVSDHLLYINGEVVSLRDLCGRNAHITIEIK